MGWDPVSDIRGPQGEQGTQGDPGPKGDKGDPGLVTTQAELEAALSVGGDVYCDSGVTINLTSRMDITHPTRLIGGKFTRSTGEAFRITSSNVEISGVSITGGGGSTYEQAQKLIRAVGTSSGRLSGINIHNCTMLYSRGDNIWLEWCEGANVSRNKIHHFLYSGVMVLSGIRCVVSENDIYDAPLTGSVLNTYGISFTDLDNTIAARSRNCIATGNVISLIDWEGIDTHGGESITISNNIVLGCPRGIALVTGNESRVTQPQRCVVTGNRIDGTGMRLTAREGITLAGIPGGIADALITDNTIDNNGAPFYLDYYDRGKTFIGSNSVPQVPWTNIPLTSNFVPGALGGSPQWSLDGNVVRLRGSIIRSNTGQNPFISNALPSAARPTINQYVGTMKVASNASTESSILLIQPSGQLQMVYETGTSTFNWILSGSYQVP